MCLGAYSCLYGISMSNKYEKLGPSHVFPWITQSPEHAFGFLDLQEYTESLSKPLVTFYSQFFFLF